MTVKRGNSLVNELRFDRGAIYIGSQVGSSVHLPDANVAKRHAVVFSNEEGAWFFRHLAHDQHSLINGEEQGSDDDRSLTVGDRIAIADFTIEISDIEFTGPNEFRPTSENQAPRSETLPAGSLVKKTNEAIRLSHERIFQVSEHAFHLAEVEALGALITETLNAVLTTVPADCAYLGLRPGSGGPLQLEEVRINTGQAADPPPTALKISSRVLNRGNIVLVTQPEDPRARSAMAVPLIHDRNVYGILYVQNAGRRESFQVADLDYLRVIAALFMNRRVTLQKARSTRRRALAGGEESIARAIQRSLMPHEIPKWDQFSTMIVHEEGSHPCGDIYDVARLSKGQSALAVASSQGGSADTLVTAPLFASAFRFSTAHMDAPHLLLQGLNWLSFERAGDPIRLCCAFAVVDPESGRMRFASAGPVGVLIISANGEHVVLGEGEGPSIGEDRDAKFSSSSAILPTGCTLVIHSSGVGETRNLDDQPYGLERFRDCLCDNGDQALDKMVVDLRRDLSDFAGSRAHEKDITVLLARRLS
jgi:hypothetical protein